MNTLEDSKYKEDGCQGRMYANKTNFSCPQETGKCGCPLSFYYASVWVNAEKLQVELKHKHKTGSAFLTLFSQCSRRKKQLVSYVRRVFTFDD